MIRAELPPEVFARRPWRCLLMVPLVGLDVCLSALLVKVWMPWYLAVVLAVMIGNGRAGMMFFGHEITHGATTRVRWLQGLLALPGCAVFFFSPGTWRIWHNLSHHGHTNQPENDPDNFGTLEEWKRSSPLTRWFAKFAPGSGHWCDVLYLFTFFTIQAQSVIWAKSTMMPGFARLNRARAGLESAALIAFWFGMSVLTGIRGTVFVVLVPMAVANAIILSYVLTNHMLRPLSSESDILSTTMSVTTLRILDRVHFHFSHHVEHHLFPAMCSSQTPRVRRVLSERLGDRYLAPSHWRSLCMIFRTPRLYDGPNTLIDPYSLRREEIPHVEAELRAVREGMR
ncbi:MAG TPA: fatty acid desaturase [Thermoanaerobaculia bacterium]|jgi:fatty acid desaturase|nr:fatty acid desaturase [Thermoanaerobaculia bacterium]